MIRQGTAVDWWVVVPVKGGAQAKSRLEPPRGTDRRALARALALDTVAAAAQAVGESRVLVVTGSRWVRAALRDTSLVVVADPGGGLNAAVRAGLHHVPRAALLGTAPPETAPLDTVPSHTAQPGPAVCHGAAVLLGDLPAARAVDIRAALAAAAAHPRAVVPDHRGEGTVLLTALVPHSVVPAFGPSSASRHTALGHRLLALDLPRLRTDVDDSHDLDLVLALGVGPRTAAVLGLPTA